MIALVIIGLVVVVGVAVAWSRVGLARSERRSMQSYEHALHVLGDVAKRSDAAAKIHPVKPEEAAHGYIRTEHTSHVGRLEPTQPPAPRIESVPVHFEDDSDAFERAREEESTETIVAAPPPAAFAPPPPADVAAEPPTAIAPPPGSPPAAVPAAAGSASEAWRPAAMGSLPDLPWGRIASAAAAVVIVTGLVVAGIELTGGSTHSSAPGQRHHRDTPPSTAPPTTKAPSTTTPTALVPVSTSLSDVAFVAPKGAYDVLLTDTGGTCWVGIQQTSNGLYVWQETLEAGQSATYKATGSIVVRIGAPKYLGVKVNGLPARLPGYVQPYDLSFNPSSPPSSA